MFGRGEYDHFNYFYLGCLDVFSGGGNTGGMMAGWQFLQYRSRGQQKSLIVLSSQSRPCISAMAASAFSLYSYSRNKLPASAQIFFSVSLTNQLWTIFPYCENPSRRSSLQSCHCSGVRCVAMYGVTALVTRITVEEVELLLPSIVKVVFLFSSTFMAANAAAWAWPAVWACVRIEFPQMLSPSRIMPFDRPLKSSIFYMRQTRQVSSTDESSTAALWSAQFIYKFTTGQLFIWSFKQFWAMNRVIRSRRFSSVMPISYGILVIMSLLIFLVLARAVVDTLGVQLILGTQEKASQNQPSLLFWFFRQQSKGDLERYLFLRYPDIRGINTSAGIGGISSAAPRWLLQSLWWLLQGRLWQGRPPRYLSRSLPRSYYLFFLSLERLRLCERSDSLLEPRCRCEDLWLLLCFLLVSFDLDLRFFRDLDLSLEFLQVDYYLTFYVLFYYFLELIDEAELSSTLLSGSFFLFSAIFKSAVFSDMQFIRVFDYKVSNNFARCQQHTIIQLMSEKKYLASLDQSTTSTKFSLFCFDGTLMSQQIIPHKQISQKEGWLEHDPLEILEAVRKSILATVTAMKSKVQGFKVGQICGLGLCNQRQTVVCWDAETHKPLYNAIVWCDARTKEVCERFKQKHGNFVQKTGLPVSTYFSLFKILWLLENVEGLRQKTSEGKVRFGTIDTWVALFLTGKYVTDASNASRTHLMDIRTGQWDKQLLEIAQITPQCLPKIINSFQQVGPITIDELKGIPLCCILGDQQSSAYAHSLTATQMKITYGTGCFLLTNIGNQPILDSAFVTTVLFQQNGQRTYGFQISVECGGGTINWAKKAGFLTNYDQLNNLEPCPQGLHFMPSFGTIFSPFWKTDVQGGVIGLNFNTTKQHILRSLLDSITYRLWDNIKNEKFNKITNIIVDGGMTANKALMQMQADMFGKQIEVRSLDTCWGVAKGVMTSLGIQGSKMGQHASYFYKTTAKHEEYVHGYRKWCEVRDKFYGWHAHK